MSNTETVQFTKQQMKDFIAVYNKAVKDDASQFTFDGREYVRAYAYYMIQYFEMEKFITGKFDDKKKYTQYGQ